MKIRTYGNFNLAVIGGGMAGFAASLEASRRGAHVILIEHNAFPGGVATASLCPNIMGYSFNGRQIVSGIADELVRELDKIGCAAIKHKEANEFPIGNAAITSSVVTTKSALQYVMNNMLDKAKVHTLYYTSLVNARENDNKIKYICCNCREGVIRINASYFIDASGDAILLHRAGAETREYACEKSMAKTLLLHLGGVRNFCRTTVKESYVRACEKNGPPVPGQDNFMGFSIPFHENEVHLNFTMTAGEALTSSACTIMDKELRRQAFHGAEWFKKYIPGFEKSYIVDIADSIGVRCARGIVGRETITLKDITAENPVKEPLVFSNCYYGDHYVKNFHAPWRNNKSMIRPVPFGALVPVRLENVIAAGRCISSEPEVVTSFRLMATCMATGQAAGMAACFAPAKAVQNIRYSELEPELKRTGVLLL
ncbi:MAG TPA: hypothetical protein DC049_08110 [Spirochaetia bacterium]|nr:hypothetical protein [Spirochaetia bacterium]